MWTFRRSFTTVILILVWSANAQDNWQNPNNQNNWQNQNNQNNWQNPNNQNNWQNPNNQNDNWQNQNNQPQYGNNNGNIQEDCCEDYCYDKDETLYLNFGTKTAYVSLPKRYSGNQHVVPECTPIQFWTLIRHGTRYPNGGKIEKLRGLIKLHEEIALNYGQRRSYPDKGRLCREDYDLFMRWRWNNTVSEDKANALTSQGVEDLKLLARRYKSKYPQLFQNSYDDRYYNFLYENLDRTQESYQAYIEGLFGSEAYRVHANIFNDERLSKVDSSCRTIEDQQGRTYNTRAEYESFISSPDYQKMVHDVFRRLGFKYNLNVSIISDIYDMCRYEKAWNVQQRSPWCIAFTKNHLSLLEYGEDLKHYYKSGYGNKLSEKIGCSPVKDFYEKFEKAVYGDDSGSKATFYFTKSSTLLNVLTAMGVGKDYIPLTGTNYYQQGARKWKTSELSPFAGNLAAVLYECKGSEKHKVMFYLNENPIDFPECSVGLCNWSAVEQKFQGIVKNCNIDSACRGQSAATILKISYVLYTLSAIFILNLKF